ncbi:MAG: alpha-glucan family phosphorylase [Geodermatophilaceae bacterium]|nr:alpha-glucan family phosphorylase [Geodermatophilaceae bacterium]
MKALRRFTVRATLPPQLAPLSDLVLNLRWSWHAETRELFEAMDPELWRTCNGDPVKLLGEISGQRLAALSTDKRFLRTLSGVVEDLQEYLTAPQWYQGGADRPAGVAYFSPEFGITEVLPQYSGGLGILAGDHLKAASDLGVPILAVGLLYRAGYFSQSLSADGWQLEHYPAIDPHGLPLALLRDEDGAAVRIEVGLPEGRTLHAQVWKVQVGRVPLLLLDSDVEENEPSERSVTDRLYGGGKDHRLVQEMLLGIGGVRAIRAYCRVTGAPAPEVFHTNEGHAGFLGLERIRELVDRPTDGAAAPLSFDEALKAVRAGTVFTTHTPVPAGIDRFPVDLIRTFFGGPNPSAGVPIERMLALGAEGEDPSLFNMAHMGLRLGQRANGVSRLHGEVSRSMFGSLWPDFDTGEIPITSVTNGVHAPTWVAPEILELATGSDGLRLLGEGTDFDAIDDVPAEVIWRLRRDLRGRLVDEVRRRVRASALQRGGSEAEVGWADTVLNRDVLTIGFARRVPSYKRLTLMLRDPQRLRDLLLDPDRPIQLVIAGKSHPADDGGKKLIQEMVRFADDPELRHRLVFLPNYDIGMARYLYWGCDVWLNNPLRPLEACGTSGMKSALNGGLNLSIRDGWWDEMYDGANGWAIPTADGVGDPEHRDDLEASALYDLLGKQVATRFYDRSAGSVPGRWVEMVRHTLSTLGPKVLATRMVREYVEELYAPAARAAATLGADDFAGARGLAAWQGHVTAQWGGVRVTHVESSGVGDTPELGSSLSLRAEVDLAGLGPEDVDVQAAYGTADEAEQLHDVSIVPMKHVGAEGSRHWFEAAVPLERTGGYGYTVRVLPYHRSLSSPAELGLVVSA